MGPPKTAVAGFVAVLLGVPAEPARGEPPVLQYIYPAGAARGTAATVRLGGKLPEWPLAVTVTDLDGSPSPLSAEAGEAKGEITVRVPADTPPGAWWVRLHGDSGASAPRAFIAGILPEVVETEPNDAPGESQHLEAPRRTVNGRLERRGDVDGYSFELSAGETLVAEVVADRLLASPMDATLQVVSSEGFVLGENDDARELDPRVVFTAPAAGSYIVRVFAFPKEPSSRIAFANGEDYVYRLTLTTAGFVDHVLPPSWTRGVAGTVELAGWNIPQRIREWPIAAGGAGSIVHDEALANSWAIELVDCPVLDEESAGAGKALVAPSIAAGRIESPDETDVYPFEAKKDERIRFRIDARKLGSPLDAELRVLSETGDELARADDSGGADCELTFRAPREGAFRLEVRDLFGHGGPHHFYQLVAERPEPDFALVLAADRYVLTPGKPLEIPVTVVRADGHAADLDVRVAGLPDGVESTPGRSQAKSDSEKKVTVVLAATAGPWNGPVRVEGSPAGAGSPLQRASVPLAGSREPLRAVWLTVLAPSGKDVTGN